MVIVARRRRALVVLLVVVLALIALGAPWSPAPRAQSPRPAINRQGELGGAPYLMSVPENWQGGLVVFAHGIQRGTGPGDATRPPIASHIASAGHAWISSGYRAREYQPHLFIEDLVALRELFLQVLGMPGSYTARGRQFDSVVKYLMGGDQAGNDLPLRLDGLSRRYLLNVMYRPRNLDGEPNPGIRAASTAHVKYRIDPGLGWSEDELNARVRRVHPHKDARSASAHPVYAERTGRLTVPLLTLHETGDAWVPLSLEQSYRRRTIAAGTDHLLVQRVYRAGSHCGVDGNIRRQAFDDLVDWIERGVRPKGDDVLAHDLSRIGLEWTPALLLDDPLASTRKAP